MVWRVVWDRSFRFRGVDYLVVGRKFALTKSVKPALRRELQGRSHLESYHLSLFPMRTSPFIYSFVLMRYASVYGSLRYWEVFEGWRRSATSTTLQISQQVWLRCTVLHMCSLSWVQWDRLRRGLDGIVGLLRRWQRFVNLEAFRATTTSSVKKLSNTAEATPGVI